MPDTELTSGQLISHYRILDKLGGGGMGVVYRAEDTNLGRAVALKFLPDELTLDPRALERFQREAKAASALNHPNICTIFDIAHEDGRHFIAMELLQGQTLREVISRGPVALDRVQDWSAELAAGLDASHRKGIVHRDIKPANIFITSRGEAKLLDFGLAKICPPRDTTKADDASSTELTSRDAVLGTLEYMSPEQVLGKPLDARTDLFSLGVVMYEMATGRRPFTGNTSGTIFDSILHKNPPSPARANPDLASGLEHVISKLIEKNADLRYQSAAELQTDLKRLKRDSDAHDVKRRDAAEHSTLWQSPWVWLAGLLIIAVSIFLGFYFSSKESNHWAEAQDIKIIPLTSYPGAEENPSFSPDGNEIAFTWNNDLYIKQLGNEKAVLLTKDALSPAWSPDGRSIAFARSLGATAIVLSIPSIGGSERKLSDASSYFDGSARLSWSPDSKWLSFPGPDIAVPIDVGSNQVHLLNVETMERRILSNPSTDCKTPLIPAFSAGGDVLAIYCMSSTMGIGGIYLQPLLGGKPKELVHLHGAVCGVAWSADDKSIVYCLDSFLWRLPIDGGVARKLPFGQDVQGLSVARVGKRLAYSQGNLNRNLHIRRVDLTGPAKPLHNPITIISSSQGDSQQCISPDGKRIAFVSARSGSGEVWVAGSDGTNPVQLTSLGGGTPRWSPDSQRIVFDSRVSGHAELYNVSADGGAPQRLPTGTPDASLPSWSSDGQWIYFNVSTGQLGIYKVPAGGGSAIQLTKDPGYLPRELPGAGRLVYIMASGELRSVAITGGDEQPINGIPLNPGYPDTWVPTRAGIYFLDQNTKPPSIQLFNLTTRRLQHIIDIQDEVPFWGASPSVSADGKILVWAEATASEADIMLVEGFQ